MDRIGLWPLFILTITKPGEAFARITQRQGIKLFLIMVTLAGLALALGQLPLIKDAYSRGLLWEIGHIAGSVAMTSIITIVGWFAMSMVLCPLVGGVQGEYHHALGILGVAWVPMLFYCLLRAVYIALMGEPLVFANDYVLALFENLNPFVLWNVILSQ